MNVRVKCDWSAKPYFKAASVNERLSCNDAIITCETERREFIRRAVTSGECFVAEQDEKVIGYGVFNYSFYHSGFIEMIYIGSDYHRSDAGAALVKDLESLCQTPANLTATLT